MELGSDPAGCDPELGSDPARPDAGGARGRRGGWAVGGLLSALLAIALAVALGLATERRLAQRDAFLAEARALDAAVFAPALMKVAAREADPWRAAAEAARALLIGELDFARLRGLSDVDLRREVARSTERLAWIEARGRDLLTRRPGSFEGPYLVGGAAFARAVRSGRLDSELASWEPPLRLAVERAPRDIRPLRFLVAAYLEAWSVLPHATRHEVDRLVERAFGQPEVLAALLDRWLVVRGHGPVALAVLPPEPAAWRAAQRVLAANGDLAAWLRADDELRRLARAAAGAALARGHEALLAGDLAVARRELLSVLTLASRDRAGADLVAAALAECPAGVPAAELQQAAAFWLTWDLDLALIDRNLLPAAAVARLDSAVLDAPPVLRARAALVAGDLPLAERLARRHATAADGEWAPYFLMAAKVLAARGETAAAADAWARVETTWQRSPMGVRVAQSLRAGRDSRSAGASAAAESAPSSAALASAPVGAGQTVWPATAWRYRAGEAWLVIDAGAGLAGFELALHDVPPGGAVVELALDDETLRTVVQVPTERPTRDRPAGRETAAGAPHSGATLRFPRAVSAGLHLLRFETLTGGTVRPGTLAGIDRRN